MAIVLGPGETSSVDEASKTRIFLAGGITNCPDWQSVMINKLAKHDVIIYNPRRQVFKAEWGKAQIEWEYDKLSRADIISFWFSRGSLNPITLYELGRWVTGNLDREASVGVDPEYERKMDVVYQTELARPDINIVHSLDDLYLDIVMTLMYLRK